MGFGQRHDVAYSGRPPQYARRTTPSDGKGSRDYVWVELHRIFIIWMFTAQMTTTSRFAASQPWLLALAAYDRPWRLTRTVLCESRRDLEMCLLQRIGRGFASTWRQIMAFTNKAHQLSEEIRELRKIQDMGQLCLDHFDMVKSSIQDS